jgi:hypothetical protein
MQFCCMFNFPFTQLLPLDITLLESVVAPFEVLPTTAIVMGGSYAWFFVLVIFDQFISNPILSFGSS